MVVEVDLGVVVILGVDVMAVQVQLVQRLLV